MNKSGSSGLFLSAGSFQQANPNKASRKRGAGAQLVTIPGTGQHLLPAIVVAEEGREAAQAFVEFFLANLRTENTRSAYCRAILRFLGDCQRQGLALWEISAGVVAAHIEGLGRSHSVPTTKQALAAIRSLFDWLVVRRVVPVNPASSVRGPRHSVRRGKTPVLDAEQVRALLESIDTAQIGGLRDRALIACMFFSFARVSAVVGLDVEDYFTQGRRGWLRLNEKGGKIHEVPAHHQLEQSLDAYILAAGIGAAQGTPLFRTLNRRRQLTDRRLSRSDALQIVKRRARAAGLPAEICNHSFRASGVTTYLQAGGTLERAQAIAGHASSRTTALYDRRDDLVTLDEIERISL